MHDGTVEALIASLSDSGTCGRLLHTHTVPERIATSAPIPAWVTPQVRAALSARGIDSLWEHQRQAAELVTNGEHVVLATGTSSGKSLGYLLPILSALEATGQPDAALSPGRPPTALYLAPTKALAGDQLASINALGIPGVYAATYDGDTPGEQRAWVRRHANFVLTNPDMLHRSLLPQHSTWRRLWRGLRFVIIDESHTYRGVFGAHVAAVLRRLRRICALAGADPVFVCASATSADPAQHCQALLGLPVTAVTGDASPQAPTTFAFMERDSAAGTLTLAARTLAALVAQGAGTIVFARSRAGSEVIASRARAELAATAPELVSRVAAYRGGYLPEDRRQIESDLRSGALRGLAATSALELGIDISGLDAVVLAGWPGSRASLWQRAGRAGRRGQSSLTVFIAGDDPVDSYYAHHPEAVFDAPAEATVLDAANPHILGPHLAAAAYEHPIRAEDADFFGAQVPALAQRLTDAGLLRRRRDGWYWTRSQRPADEISLRGCGPVVRIVEHDTGRVLGTVDESRAHYVVHRGAVHLHQQQPYVVTDLDLDTGTATVVPGDPGWSTMAQASSAFDIMSLTHELHGQAGVSLFFGQVRVRTQVVSFQRKLPDGSLLGTHPLELPERQLVTAAVWWTIEPDRLAAAGILPAQVAGSAHAAEHAAIGLMPLVATVDPGDLGGVSTSCHPDTGLPTVLVYDGTPGGAGLAQRGFEVAPVWLDGTAEAVAACQCPTGCPSCIQSPRCGSGNEPLDKAGAITLLRLTVAGLLAR